jgi:hypothetical protein
MSGDQRSVEELRDAVLTALGLMASAMNSGERFTLQVADAYMQSGPALAQLAARAERGERVEAAAREVAILEMHPDFSDEENEELRRRAVAFRAALADTEGEE